MRKYRCKYCDRLFLRNLTVGNAFGECICFDCLEDLPKRNENGGLVNMRKLKSDVKPESEKKCDDCGTMLIAGEGYNGLCDNCYSKVIDSLNGVNTEEQIEIVVRSSWTCKSCGFVTRNRKEFHYHSGECIYCFNEKRIPMFVGR